MSQAHPEVARSERAADTDGARVKDQLLGALERELAARVSTLPTHFSETFTDTGAPSRFIEVDTPEITGETMLSEIQVPTLAGSRD